jgi:hypothetical protein
LSAENEHVERILYSKRGANKKPFGVNVERLSIRKEHLVFAVVGRRPDSAHSPFPSGIFEKAARLRL